ncbi:MAG TPA: CatB-related O-acetyltransferase [Mucilaginibacter sp.]|nr:CatB-related O-acetyltransferase [Mucilaginibacter sp.]
MLTNFLRFLKTLVSSSDVRWDNLRIFVSDDSSVDKNTRIYAPAKLVGVAVGKGTYIAFNATITNTTIGKFCSIGPNLLCGWGVHPLNGISTSPVFYSTKKQAGFTLSNADKIEERKPIKIGNDVFIGANVVILDGVEIGDGAVIGAGAVVNKNIPPYAVAVGIPAKVTRYRFDEDTIENLQKKRWWEGSDEDLRRVEAMFFDVEGFVSSPGE